MKFITGVAADKGIKVTGVYETFDAARAQTKTKRTVYECFDDCVRVGDYVRAERGKVSAVWSEN